MEAVAKPFYCTTEAQRAKCPELINEKYVSHAVLALD